MLRNGMFNIGMLAGGSADLDAGDILDALEGVFTGTFLVQRGRMVADHGPESASTRRRRQNDWRASAASGSVRGAC
jgi:hypothetical protein